MDATSIFLSDNKNAVFGEAGMNGKKALIKGQYLPDFCLFLGYFDTTNGD